MTDPVLRRRLAAAAMAAALAAGPSVGGCVLPPEGGGEATVAVAADSGPDRPSDPKALVFEDQAFAFPHDERVVLSNGMVVHMIVDRSLPLVDGSAIFRGGSAFDPEGKEGLASIACGMVRRGGTASLDPAALDEQLDLIAGSVGVGADSENLAASFSFLSKDLDRGLELFADVLRNPRFDSGRFQQTKAAAAQGVQRQFESPGGVLSRAFGNLVHGGHPYGRLVTPQSIGGLTEDDLKAFHAKWFHPEAFVLAVAGDFDPEELEAKLEKAFAGWEEAAEPLPRWPRPFDRAYRAGHHVVAMPKVTQTNVRMGHWGPPQNSVDRVHFDVMNMILGGGGFWSRMTTVVRTREGLAYSVFSFLGRGSQGGVFQAGVQTKPSTTYRAVSLMKRLMEEIRETPVTQEELDQAKGTILNGFVRVIESPAALANQYATLEFKEYPPDWLDRYREIVRDTTVEDCRRIAREYLRPDGLTLVVVGNPSQFDAAPEDLGPAETIQPR